MDVEIDVAIRALTEDWHTLRALRLAALADSPAAFLGRPEEEARWPAEQWQRSLEHKAWFAAFTGPSPIGLASAVHDRATGDYYVESMWVDPGNRRRAVASRLFGAVERFVCGQGATVLRLWVLEGNPSAALAYRRYGFRPTGLRQEVPGYPGLIEEEFSRDLPPAERSTSGRIP